MQPTRMLPILLLPVLALVLFALSVAAGLPDTVAWIMLSIVVAGTQYARARTEQTKEVGIINHSDINHAIPVRHVCPLLVGAGV